MQPEFPLAHLTRRYLSTIYAAMLRMAQHGVLPDLLEGPASLECDSDQIRIPTQS